MRSGPGWNGARLKTLPRGNLSGWRCLRRCGERGNPLKSLTNIESAMLFALSFTVLFAVSKGMILFADFLRALIISMFGVG